MGQVKTVRARREKWFVQVIREYLGKEIKSNELIRGMTCDNSRESTSNRSPMTSLSRRKNHLKRGREQRW